MILSRRRGFVFVHIPKTGGTALALALEARAAADDILIGDTPKARTRAARVGALRSRARGRLWKHSTLADLDGVVSAEELATLFCLTLVRNPWDRAVSYWTWARAQSFAHPAVGLAKAHDFAGFLRHPQTRAALAAWPARAYMTDATGVERARLYARLERLEEDLVPFWDHLGFRLPVPRANESGRPRDWRPFYDEALAALVGQIAAEDIARFGYRFDDPAG
jgi:hypothetical protein